MATPSIQQIALRFSQANISSSTVALMSGLTPALHEVLWATDDGGDLYIAGIQLIQAIGSTKNQGAYERFFASFPDWWTVDGNIAKTIVTAYDMAIETGAVEKLDSQVESVRTWLDEDSSAFSSTYSPTWGELKAQACAWAAQDAEVLARTAPSWTSVLPTETFSYHRVIPITTGKQLVDYGRRVDKFLMRSPIADQAVAGGIRLFAVEEVLKTDLGPVAVLAIEKLDVGWRALKVYTVGGVTASQRLYKLCHQVAVRYEMKATLLAYSKTLKATTSAMTVNGLINAITYLEKAPVLHQIEQPVFAIHDTGLNGTLRYLYIDTCSLLDEFEREASRELALGTDSETKIVICGDTVKEIEALKRTRPDIRRDANAALRMIEEFQTSGKGFIETAYDAISKPYADDAIRRAVQAHADRKESVTVITADTALRIHLRANNPPGLLTAIDSKSLTDKAAQSPQYPHNTAATPSLAGMPTNQSQGVSK